MWMLFLFPTFVHTLEFTVSTDRKNLTIKGLNEIVDQDSYRKSGAYTGYVYITVEYGIVGLGSNLFKDSYNLKYIELPLSLKTIQNNCFQRCVGLTYIKIPEGVEEISESTFIYCQNLRIIDIPSTLKKIYKEGTFAECHSLNKFITHKNCIFSTLNDGTILVENKTIGVACASNSTVQIPSELSVLSEYFLNSQNPVRNIEFIGNNLNVICSRAFCSLVNLNKLILPTGIEQIDEEFILASGITYLRLPNTLSSISKQALDGAENLETVEIEEGCVALYKDSNNVIFDANRITVMFIPPNATEFTIHEPVEVVNFGSLRSRKNLKNLYVNENNTKFSSDGQTLYTKNKTIALSGIGGMKEIKLAIECETVSDSAFKSIEADSLEFLGGNVTLISTTAFWLCKIKTAKFVEGLKTITTMGFSTAQLQEIVLPSTVTFLGAECFSGNPAEIIDISKCESLNVIEFSAFIGTSVRELKLPKNMPFIGQNMFLGCKNLKRVEIPPTVDKILPNAFENSALENVTILGNNLKEIDNYCFQTTNIRSIELPNSLTSIGIAALSNCKSLEEIIFHNESSLSNIREDMIKGSDNLKRIWFGKSLTDISTTALGQAMGLTDIDFDEQNPKYVGRKGLIIDKTSWQIVGCGGGVRSIFIESDIESIGPSAFLNCEKLENIDFDAESRLATLGKNTFYGCSSISSLSLPIYLERIEASAFAGCKKLKSVDFGYTDQQKHLAAICESAFRDCIALEEIELPTSLESIETNAFSGCLALKYLSFNRNLISIGDTAFGGCQSLNLIAYCLDPEIELPGVSDRAFDNLPPELIVYVTEKYKQQTLGGRSVLRAIDDDCHIPTERFTQAEAQMPIHIAVYMSAILQDGNEDSGSAGGSKS